jgi:hypothetical protein
MHQYAIHQEHRTIHSCVQLENFGNLVEDRALKAGGLQRIITLDGFVYPLDIIQGLPYLKMRKPTDEEYAMLPHFVLTADVPFITTSRTVLYLTSLIGSRIHPIGAKESLIPPLISVGSTNTSRPNMS